MIIKVFVSLIPVFLFLIMLLYLDSLKLVSKTLLIICLAWGLMSAGISFFLNTFLINHLEVSFESYSGFIAPFVEEFLKCGMLWLLIKRNKIGFMIDGAIYGFSIGAAFSFAENLFYLSQFAGDSSNLMIWITRGFGTAIMHGGTAAIFGILCMSALNRQSSLVMATGSGLLASIIIHGIFNQFLVSPLISTLIIILLVPLSIILIFVSNEKSIRNWLELEFDSEVTMLRMIRKGQFSQTKTGSFLVSLKKHFPGEVVLDMYCFISLYLELSMKAKSLIMLKENDIVIQSDPDLPVKLKELKSLKKSIGRGGYLAIAPVLRMSRKDLWKLYLLEKV
ncbi:MAG: PrsW family glutamic-type intramembrane protease [Bacteroidota bacterium]